MSTYNSKFSGAQIDELLEKVASGQVGGGGGGSSEKEELAKEMGATHKHKITLSIEMPDMGMKLRWVVYNSSAESLNAETLLTFILTFGDPLYINGSVCANMGGQVITGEALLVVGEDELCVSMVKVADVDGVVKDFPSPISAMLENGFTFTDDVTEL